MNSEFRLRSKLIQKKLAALSGMQENILAQQQAMLARSVNLTRFVKQAALYRMREVPEVQMAHEYLASVLPAFGQEGKRLQISPGVLKAYTDLLN